MSNIQDSNNNKNISIKKEDNIMSVKPEAIKMDILLFKNDVLREIKQIEKGIIDKSKETNNILKNKITLFDNKMKFINDQISSMSNKMINGIKIEERINILSQAREQLLDETTTNKIKISMLEKEMRDSVNRIDDILKQTVIYPSIIGLNGKFRNFHEFIDFVISESTTNNNFRQKNIMDLSSYKLKIEKVLQALGFKIESILSSCNSFTLTKCKELQEKFDYNLGLYKEKLNDLRIENSNYVIQLEKDTKDLRNETNIIKDMKNNIFSKVDNEVDNMKKEQEIINETFKGYKNEFEKMDQTLKKVEKNIENLVVQKIILLFDGQKKLNENIEELRKEKNDFYNIKIKDIINEQIKNALKESNIRQVNLNDNFNINLNNQNNNQNNQNNVNTQNNLNNQNIQNNINIQNSQNIQNNRNNSIYNNIKEKNYSINNSRRGSVFSGRFNMINTINNNMQNNIPNNINNNILNYQNNINNNNINNNMNNYSSPRRNNNENDNYHLNIHGNTVNNYNNIIMNKKILENINNINYNQKNNGSMINNINQNILSELKNDNILSVKKSKKHYKLQRKHSFQSDSNHEDKYIINDNFNMNSQINTNNNRLEQNVNKYSIVSKNKIIHKFNNKIKSGKQNQNNNLENYIKIYNINKNKKGRRRSFDEEKNEDLQKFQKLLKININDVDAKLNNLDNISSSFELLNENAEIFDRFVDSNTITKDNINNNINENMNIDYNKKNILLSPLNNNNKNNITEKNSIEEDLSTKNIIAAKTTSDFYSKEYNKKIRIESSLKPIKNKKILQYNKIINGNNSIGIKKTNSDLFNLQSNLKSKGQRIFNQNTKVSFLGTTGDNNKQSEDSINKCHNYFIGFQFGGGQEDNKKIRKTKKKSKSSKNSQLK